jgi:hypothetical protein
VSFGSASQAFGWMKTIGLFHKLRHKGGRLVDWQFSFGASCLQPGALAKSRGATGVTTTGNDGFRSSR